MILWNRSSGWVVLVFFHFGKEKSWGAVKNQSVYVKEDDHRKALRLVELVNDSDCFLWVSLLVFMVFGWFLWFLVVFMVFQSGL